MIESEIAFVDLVDDMMLGEDMIRHLVKFVMTECQDDLELFTKYVNKALSTTLENIVSNNSIRLPYTDAISILEKANKKFEYTPAWGKDLQSGYEQFLIEQHFK